MSKKQSFVLYHDLNTVLDKLTNDEAGMLFKMILKFVNDEQYNSNNPLLEALFETIKLSLVRNQVKYEEIVKKRSEAGKKSAEVRSNTGVTNSTHVNFVEQDLTHVNTGVTNSTDSVPVPVPVPVSDSVINLSVNINNECIDFIIKKELANLIAEEANNQGIGTDENQGRKLLYFFIERKRVHKGCKNTSQAIKLQINKLSKSLEFAEFDYILDKSIQGNSNGECYQNILNIDKPIYSSYSSKNSDYDDDDPYMNAPDAPMKVIGI